MHGRLATTGHTSVHLLGLVCCLWLSLPARCGRGTGVARPIGPQPTNGPHAHSVCDTLPELQLWHRRHPHMHMGSERLGSLASEEGHSGVGWPCPSQVTGSHVLPLCSPEKYLVVQSK